MDFEGKNVLVYGTGLSGLAAAKLLGKLHANIFIYDEIDKEQDIEKLFDRFGGEVKLLDEIGDNVSFHFGELSTELIKKLDIAVLSPGVPLDIPQVESLKRENILIWGEVELAYQIGRGKVLAITGTNGKTTTTALLGEIMKAYHKETYVVGNIGMPYTDIALDTTKNSIIVAETSSFQLETIQNFKPYVSSILNITPDHLDRHKTMELYIAAKERIADNQDEDDYCILNCDNENSRNFASTVRAKPILFSRKKELEEGVYIKSGKIIVNFGKEEVCCSVSELNILGEHNLENVLAAVAMAAVFGVPLSLIGEVVKEFKGVAHRIEFVLEKEGVVYYNDSKGTNPDAAIKGIQAMNRPTVLIAGGFNKNASYEEWISSFDGKVKELVLVGETKEIIARKAKSLGFNNITVVETFEEAVKRSIQMAEEGDAVLLSPACASWGMFGNYEERGDKFKEIVRMLG
jgi:UDP-N-acetylmuramoylalanine--D-glutamate ligase